ncbi:glycosyltransferase family 2 protein [Demequina pelophila]|uniref:glycosyltransferase family 2 protein n=1 Tax=Demequina pelophila TaxID=1638984 RepID=UPI0007857AFD|nr:glycosyltransferase family 2 protein [Demequina pelophila]
MSEPGVPRERRMDARPARLAATFVIPVPDEERHVEAAIRSVLAQRGLEEFELLVMLGRSRNRNRTDEIVARLVAEDSRVRALPNPRNAISIAMNIGIAEAVHPYIVRVDAHAVLPPDYAQTAIRTLQRTGAANVGGRMRAEGVSRFERAVAWGYNSPAGLGGAIYHTGGEAGLAESAYLGVFRREPVLAIGGFDEDLARGEDWEFNRRLARSGGVVWFEPELEVVYRPRPNLPALVRQFHASGRWRGELIRRLGASQPIRYFVPPALVVSFVIGAVLLVVGPLALHGAIAWLVAGLGASPFIVYGGWLAWTASRADVAPALRVRLLAVLPTMHAAWGAGCIAGIVKAPEGQNAYAGR